MSYVRVICVGLFILILGSQAQAQWFDQQSVSETILLEKQEGRAIVPHGTGFLLWNYPTPDSMMVVTCAHLLKGEKIFVRVNADTSFIRAAAELNKRFVSFGDRTWEIVGHTLRTEVNLLKLSAGAFEADSTSDIAAFLIAIPARIETGRGHTIYRFAKSAGIPASGIRARTDVSLGDELYFVGFPLTIGTQESLEPVIRSGAVAWLSPAAAVFLIDAFSFAGNSGSPVFTKATPGSTPFLIGMVQGHVTAADDTNTGLAQCVWIDEILAHVARMNALAR